MIFKKTELGLKELNERKFKLTVKQRRSLLLIGTDDFQKLGIEQQQKMADDEVIQALLELKLIEPVDMFATDYLSDDTATKPAPVQTAAPVVTPAQPAPTVAQTTPTIVAAPVTPTVEPTPVTPVIPVLETPQPVQAAITPAQLDGLLTREEKIQALHPETKPQTEILGFTDIQTMMIDTLKQYSGLMSKGLINKIQSSTHFTDLKKCQMQWLTTLQETRIPPAELNAMLKTFKASYTELEKLAG